MTKTAKYRGGALLLWLCALAGVFLLLGVFTPAKAVPFDEVVSTPHYTTKIIESGEMPVGFYDLVYIDVYITHPGLFTVEIPEKSKNKPLNEQILMWDVEGQPKSGPFASYFTRWWFRPGDEVTIQTFPHGFAETLARKNWAFFSVPRTFLIAQDATKLSSEKDLIPRCSQPLIDGGLTTGTFKVPPYNSTLVVSFAFYYDVYSHEEYQPEIHYYNRFRKVTFGEDAHAQVKLLGTKAGLTLYQVGGRYREDKFANNEPVYFKVNVNKGYYLYDIAYKMIRTEEPVKLPRFNEHSNVTFAPLDDPDKYLSDYSFRTLADFYGPDAYRYYKSISWKHFIPRREIQHVSPTIYCVPPPAVGTLGNSIYWVRLGSESMYNDHFSYMTARYFDYEITPITRRYLTLLEPEDTEFAFKSKTGWTGLMQDEWATVGFTIEDYFSITKIEVSDAELDQNSIQYTYEGDICTGATFRIRPTSESDPRLKLTYRENANKQPFQVTREVYDPFELVNYVINSDLILENVTIERKNGQYRPGEKVVLNIRNDVPVYLDLVITYQSATDPNPKPTVLWDDTQRTGTRPASVSFFMPYEDVEVGVKVKLNKEEGYGKADLIIVDRSNHPDNDIRFAAKWMPDLEVWDTSVFHYGRMGSMTSQKPVKRIIKKDAVFFVNAGLHESLGNDYGYRVYSVETYGTPEGETVTTPRIGYVDNKVWSQYGGDLTVTIIVDRAYPVQALHDKDSTDRSWMGSDFFTASKPQTAIEGTPILAQFKNDADIVNDNPDPNSRYYLFWSRDRAGDRVDLQPTATLIDGTNNMTRHYFIMPNEPALMILKRIFDVQVEAEVVSEGGGSIALSYDDEHLQPGSEIRVSVTEPYGYTLDKIWVEVSRKEDETQRNVRLDEANRSLNETLKFVIPWPGYGESYKGAVFTVKARFVEREKYELTYVADNDTGLTYTDYAYKGLPYTIRTPEDCGFQAWPDEDFTGWNMVLEDGSQRTITAAELEWQFYINSSGTLTARWEKARAVPYYVRTLTVKLSEDQENPDAIKDGIVLLSGYSVQLEAVITRGGDYEDANNPWTEAVKWELDGYNHAQKTKIDQNGVLTLGEDQSFDVNVSVTSLYDNKTKVKTLFSVNRDIHELTVRAEPEEGGGVTGSTILPTGVLTSISAKPAYGWAFTGWYIDDEDDNDDNDERYIPGENPVLYSTTPVYTFVYIPKADLKLKAKFVRCSYDIEVVNGTASIGGNEITAAQLGDVVTITATPPTVPVLDEDGNETGARVALEGYVFVKWECPNNIVSFEDPTSLTTTFTMGVSNVTVYARYAMKDSSLIDLDPMAVSVLSGVPFTVSGTVRTDEATLTWDPEIAQTPSGQVTVTVGNDSTTIDLDENGAFTCDLTLTGTGSQQVTVTYEGDAHHRGTMASNNVYVNRVSSIDLVKGYREVYQLGAPLELDTMRLHVTWTDNTEDNIPVTEDMVSGFNSSEPGNHDLTVKYGGAIVTVEVAVKAVYTITFDVGETGTAPAPMETEWLAVEGKALLGGAEYVKPADIPSDSLFGGWTYENGNSVDYNHEITRNVTLYAKWLPVNEIIDLIALNIDKPVIGQPIPEYFTIYAEDSTVTLADLGVSLPAEMQEIFDVTSGYWINADGVMETDFTEGQTYTLNLNLQAKNANAVFKGVDAPKHPNGTYVNPNDIFTVTVNGIEYTNPDHTFDSYADASVSVASIHYTVTLRTPTCQVTVTGGRAEPSSAAAGETVTLIPEPGAGYTFKEWYLVSGDVELVEPDPEGMTPWTTFVAGNEDVEVEAVFITNTTLTLTADKDPCLPGETVTLTGRLEGAQGNLLTTATGEVTVTVGGTTYTPALNGGTFTLEFATAESVEKIYNIIVNYNGDENHTAAFLTSYFEAAYPAQPAPAFVAHSLTLGGQIGVNFFMTYPEGFDPTGSYMTFSISSKGGLSLGEVPYSASKEYGDRRRFTCLINAVQMADRITATFHYTREGVEKKVIETFVAEDFFPAFDGACAQGTVNASDKEVDVVHTLADYGYHMQQFLSEVRSWTLGEDYADMNTVYTDNYADEYEKIKADAKAYATVVENETNGDIQAVFNALTVDSNTVLNVYFEPSANYTGTTIEASVDGKPIQIQKGTDGRFCVEIKGISAHKLSTPHVIKITTENGTATVTASALSYVNSAFQYYTNDNDASGNARNAAAAIWKYAAAANAYKAPATQNS